jgi:capping protein beta
MPPKDISANLEATLELAPDIIEDLLASVDQPLKEILDTSCNRPFLICDYNRLILISYHLSLCSDVLKSV